MEDGKVTQFGVMTHPFSELNILDADLEIFGLKLPWGLKNFRLKEWQHFGIIGERYYFGMIILDAKFSSLSFFYGVDLSNGKLFVFSRNPLFARRVLSRELFHGECYFNHLGYFMEFDNRLSKGFHRLMARVSSPRRGGSVSAEFLVHEDLEKIQPLVLVSPLGENKPLYTHKAACPCEGKVRIPGMDDIILEADKTVCLIDVHKGYYPYRTFWNWATFGFYDDNGRLIAMNACENLVRNDEEFNENCVWVDGKIGLMSAVRFELDREDLFSPWKIHSTDGELDLAFSPVGEHAKRLNLGVVASEFHQLYGRFEGRIPGVDGDHIQVPNVVGICEYNRWRM